MDRNHISNSATALPSMSLSARRAWIEIPPVDTSSVRLSVALRKESVDRNITLPVFIPPQKIVALRKESVDRNREIYGTSHSAVMSLSARRAWIEMQ